jgi:transposase
MAKDLSKRIRGQIIALRNEGYSQRQIAAKIGVSKGAVQRTLKGSEKLNPIPPDQGLGDQGVLLLHHKRINS